MRNWTPGSSDRLQGCEWEKDWEDVQLVCKALDIPCQMVRLFFSPNFGQARRSLLVDKKDASYSPLRSISPSNTGRGSLSLPSTLGRRALRLTLISLVTSQSPALPFLPLLSD
jgi:hypothetical protein